MTRLATIYGINPVSEILRIPYYALRDRVVAQKTSASAAPPKATFIEFKALAPAQALAGVLELEDRAGTKMTLRLDSSSGKPAVEFVSPVRCSWPALKAINREWGSAAAFGRQLRTPEKC